MSIRLRLFYAALLGALILLTPLSFAQAAGAVVSIQAPREIAAAAVAAVPIRIADVSGLYGFEMLIKFDPAAVQVVDADAAKPGVQLVPGDFLALDFLVRNTADNGAGTAEFVLTQLNPSPAKSGSGTLFTIYFKGVAAGKTSPLTIDRFKLASRDGMEIPATGAGAELSVAAPITAAATPTALPTAVRPVLDMDVLTATPAATRAEPPPTLPPTSAPTAPSAPAASTASPAEAPTPTIAAASTISAPTPAGRGPATPTALSTQLVAAPTAPAGAPAATLTALPSAAPVDATATAVHTAAPVSARALPGTPIARAAGVSVVPARTGLLAGGIALLVLAAVALTGLVVVTRRRRA